MSTNGRDLLEERAEETDSLRSIVGADESEVDNCGAGVSKMASPATLGGHRDKSVLIFDDPLYSRETRSIVTFAIFRGKWEFENLEKIDESDENICGIKLSPLREGAHLTIAFKSMKDRVEFMDSIYADKEIHQVGGGMNLERLANSKVVKKSGGIIGLTLAGYGIYKLFKYISNSTVK